MGKNMSEKAWTGLTLTLVWTCRNVSTCLRNQWVSLLSLKRSHFSQKQPMQPSVRSFMQTCSENGPTLPNPTPDPDAHFAVIHYAATVSYNLTAWLEKNKDP